jgi:hypothetical protein
MARPAKQKVKSSPEAKRAKTKSSWSETMKKALQDKRSSSRGPQQPKPRDSGTFKVKKDSF